MTERVLAAIENPRRLHRPPDRRLIGRPSPTGSTSRRCRGAARTGTMLEINGNPTAATYPSTMPASRSRRGATIVLNTDAHGVGHARNIAYAATARAPGSAPTTSPTLVPGASSRSC